ncbi:hypothetical protein [Rhodococcus sp. I2R]|uniref:hypothetical protein n=1 Tax=Rhodococcus sp. I2R TaxID=2855445 RepID=UPI001E31A9EB|nr:hypothetical protein [Rhodococcus sp. I2R]MCC8927012.1 hypothetical protein [Rhodococcus sp. I2R]
MTMHHTAAEGAKLAASIRVIATAIAACPIMPAPARIALCISGIKDPRTPTVLAAT